MAEVDVDELWEDLQPTIEGLQDSRRLPYQTGDLYDPRLEVVKAHLRVTDVPKAMEEAKRISKRNHGASYTAFELIKLYVIAQGWHSWLSDVGKRSSDELEKAEKALRKQEERERKQAERSRG